jgi:LPS-assembly lipoprotein
MGQAQRTHRSLRAFALGAALLVALTIAGCGFRPRGEMILPFSSLFLAGPTASPVLNDVRRALESSGKTRVVAKREEAPVMLEILSDAQEKVILSLSSAGRVREFQLRHRVVFRLSQTQEEAAKPPDEILITRTVSFNDAEIISKEKEAELLFREMQNDAVDNILRRLAAAKPS